MIIVSTPAAEAPEVAEVAKPARLTFTWTGTDGVGWDLATGPVRLARGASGFGIPRPTHWHDEAPTVDGASWQGMRTGPREVFLPVHLRGTGDMVGTERAFFAGLDPSSTGTLRVTTPEVTWREIALRYAEGAEGEYEIDPLLIEYAPYPLRFIAEDPYWSGAEIVTTFVNEAAAAFFPGPPFALGQSNTLDSAEVSNPGDQPAYPLWRVTGPSTAFSIGVGTATVDAVVTLAAGEWVEIDMDPRALTVVDHLGADRWSVLTDAEFSSIPAGQTVPLVASVTGASAGTAVTLTFTPRYRRAW